jgi:hypothetical protein
MIFVAIIESLFSVLPILDSGKEIVVELTMWAFFADLV